MNTCICVKDYYNDNDIMFIKDKKYDYSYLNRINSSIIILSGGERCENEPQLAAIGFSHEDFKKYWENDVPILKDPKFIRLAKLRKLL